MPTKKRPVTKFHSRKLFLILAFLLIDSDSYTNSPILLGDQIAFDNKFLNQTAIINTYNNITEFTASLDETTIWIQDDERNQCLGPHGFSTCGDLNMWIWHRHEKGIIFETASSILSSTTTATSISPTAGHDDTGNDKSGNMKPVERYCLARTSNRQRQQSHLQHHITVVRCEQELAATTAANQDTKSVDPTADDESSNSSKKSNWFSKLLPKRKSRKQTQKSNNSDSRSGRSEYSIFWEYDAIIGRLSSVSTLSYGASGNNNSNNNSNNSNYKIENKNSDKKEDDSNTKKKNRNIVQKILNHFNKHNRKQQQQQQQQQQSSSLSLTQTTAQSPSHCIINPQRDISNDSSNDATDSTTHILTPCVVSLQQQQQQQQQQQPASVITVTTTDYAALSIIPIADYFLLPHPSPAVDSSNIEENNNDDSNNVNSNDDSSNKKKNRIVDVGEWVCSTTGQSLPRNLDHYYPPAVVTTTATTTAIPTTTFNNNDNNNSDDYYSPGRQVLMGGGLFTKVVFGMKFHVYNLGWYVDATAVTTTATTTTAAAAFAPYYDIPYEELKQKEDFIALMTRSDLSYDRCLVIKMAMTLKKDVVIQGLTEELLISRKNAKILSDASNLYPSNEFTEGLEIIFAWQMPHRLTATAPITTATTTAITPHEILEIRIGELVTRIEEPGIAQDFFYQYFREHPVSPESKYAMLEHFPLLLQKENIPYIPTPVAAATTTAAADGNNNNPKYSSLPPEAVKNIIHNNSKKKKNSNNNNNTTKKQNNKRFSFTATFAKFLGPDHEEVKRMKRWKSYVNSLILKNHRNWQEEMILTIAILGYCLILITMSLPPAMIEKGVRVVKRIKRRSMNSLKATLSKSSSLVKLAAMNTIQRVKSSKSTDLKLYFQMGGVGMGVGNTSSNSSSYTGNFNAM